MNRRSNHRHPRPASGRSRWPDWLAPATVVAIAYYVGARVGFALTPRGQPVSTLWPPNAILLGALLLTPRRIWPALAVASFPAHVAAELPSGVPLPMVFCWFISNWAEVLIGALGVRLFAPGPPRLDTFRRVGVFVLAGVLFAPFASSFLDAGFVTLNHWGAQSYWTVWRHRFFANVLGVLTLVPAIVAWRNDDTVWLHSLAPRRALEGALLAILLLSVCTVVFARPLSAAHAVPALLYAPLPFLLWAAVRFGPGPASGSLLIVALLSVWGAIHGEGPFVGYSMGENVLSLQLFLIATSIPLLALAAVLRERHHTIADARRNEQRLNLALSAANVATWEWSISTKGDTFPRFMDAVHPADQSMVSDAVTRALAGDDSYEVEFRLAGTGPERWALSKGRVIHDDNGVPLRMLGVTADVTERRRADAALLSEAMFRESAAQLRELANAMPQIVWTACPRGHIDFFNRKWYELTGAVEGAVGAHSWLSIIHPDDRDSYLTAWRGNALAGRRHEHEARFYDAATVAYRWHLVRALPVFDDQGAIRRWYGTATDIDDLKRAEVELRGRQEELRALGENLELRVIARTAELVRTNVTLQGAITVRVRAEHALRASEERFAKAFRASPDAICISHVDSGWIIEVNERWQAMFGYPRSEAIGKTAPQLGLALSDADTTRFRSLMTSPGFIRELELDMRNRRGDVLRAVLACEVVEVGGDSCHIMMIRDITERRRAEHEIEAQRRQLAHLGRVAVLGELSGALAHELNQPLTAILANARAAQRLMSRDGFDAAEIREILGDIASNDLRAGAVIRGIRDLIRKGDSAPQPTYLNDIVREVLDLTRGDLALREVSVAGRLGELLPPVVGDRVQLQQVLINLVVNACDAMVDNPPGDRHLIIATRRNRHGVHISVRDHGTGITTERVESMFEPFMTTKEHGLGLGLAICRSIVTAHGGRMWAVNNARRGATFHVQLPVDVRGGVPD